MSRAIVTDDVACRQSEEVTDPTVDLCPGLHFAADAASGLLVLELFYVFRLVYYGRNIRQFGQILPGTTRKCLVPLLR